MRHRRPFHLSGLAALVRPVALAAGVVVLTLGAAACENNRTKLTNEQSENGLGIPDTKSEGLRVTMIRCNLDQMVVDPAADTPEQAIQDILAIASAPGDDATNFKKFQAYFPGVDDRTAHDEIWLKVKKNAPKYLQQDISQGVTYKICEKHEEPSGAVQFYIQSTDPTSKSNPPIRLKKDESGKWKVTNSSL